MLRKVVKYKDFENAERSETLYFNLTKAEMMEFSLEYPQGMEATIHQMVETENQKAIFDMMKKLIMASYGEKSPEGKFVKTKEISEIFSHTEAYSQLIDDISANTDEAVAFFNGIMSPVVTAQVKTQSDHKGA